MAHIRQSRPDSGAGRTRQDRPAPPPRPADRSRSVHGTHKTVKATHKTVKATHKTVKARTLHTSDSQCPVLAHIRQSRPYFGTHQTVKARFWHISDSQGQILMLDALVKTAQPRRPSAPIGRAPYNRAHIRQSRPHIRQSRTHIRQSRP